MDTRAIRCEGIVLRHVAYGESDLVVQLLVRGRGRVGAFARGARTSRQRYGGALEPFGRIEALLVEREGLWPLREARAIDAHGRLRDDLLRIAHATCAAELAHDLSRENEPADALFSLLDAFLSRLEQGSATSARLRAFELGAMEAAGLAPELVRCARCGGEVEPGRAAFAPDAGGLVCAACAQGTHALPLAAGPRAALLQLRWGGLDAAESPRSADGSGRPADPALFEAACREAGRAMAAFLRHHLGRELTSAEFLAQLGAPR